MKPNLKQVVEHNGNDIADLKIYYDKKIEQYKVRHCCDRCHLDLGCFCYETIDDAIYACSEVSWACMRHTLDEVWVDYELAEEIDRVCGTNLVQASADTDCYESDATKLIIDSITEKQAKEILDTVDWSDEYDDDYAGERCRL